MTVTGGDAVQKWVIDRGISGMRKVISIYYSSHSGSTLLAFLLNDHERIFSLGHMTGWNYPKDEDFSCSCQERLQECPFYGRLESRFKQAGLPFDLRNFGTDYEITSIPRLNQCLVGSLPFVGGTFIERLRDRVLYPMPKISTALEGFDSASRTLIDAALDYTGASVVTEKSNSPSRIAHLNRISGLDLYVIHLIQDIRGVVYTDIVLRNWDPVKSVRNWIQKNVLAFRYFRRVEKKITIHYEDLTDATDRTLAKIHCFVGLQPQPFGGDFKNAEHHILGNSMRLKSGKIKKDERWRSELSDRDRGLIEA